MCVFCFLQPSRSISTLLLANLPFLPAFHLLPSISSSLVPPSQIYEDGSDSPRLKASQCFTKYKWRDPAAAAAALNGGGGPMIVATQVVSDYLTSYDSMFIQVRMPAMHVHTSVDDQPCMFIHACL